MVEIVWYCSTIEAYLKQRHLKYKSIMNSLQVNLTMATTTLKYLRLSNVKIFGFNGRLPGSYVRLEY